MSAALSVGYTPDVKQQGLIPDLFATEFNVFYWPTTRMGQVTTGLFYEQAISKGDSVTIPNLPIFVTAPYTKGQKLEITASDSVPIKMKIDKARYFNVPVDKVDKKQSHLVIGPKYQAACYKQLERDVETEFWADIVTKAHAKNQGAGAGLKSGSIALGTPTAGIPWTTATATTIFTQMRVCLAEQSATMGDLWSVMGPLAVNQMLTGDNIKAAYLTGDKVSPLRSGDVGRVVNVNIAESVLIPQNTGANAANPVPVLMGNKDAISYIAQLNELRVVQHPDYMDDRFQGIFVYDWSVRKPEGLVVAWVYFA